MFDRDRATLCFRECEACRCLLAVELRTTLLVVSVGTPLLPFIFMKEFFESAEAAGQMQKGRVARQNICGNLNPGDVGTLVSPVVVD